MAGLHEFRDPIHTFIRVDDEERRVIDSAPVQRLRHIHQLAMTYLVYPGATHRRFEHSLGVMELAGQVFDVVTRRDKIHPNLPELIKHMLADETKDDERKYWRRSLRMAALCHDIGHLPFSHAAEQELLPAGWDHEQMTVNLVRSSLMERLWTESRPQLVNSDIAKLSVGPEHGGEEPFTDWQIILSDILTGDAFGVDRMDYLLRDSLHAGVAYGRFDHFRLIDTLRILPKPADEEGTDSQEPQLGVEIGGLHAAEALLLARYFMYTQVYFHRVRRIYDIHLKDFLKAWLPSGLLPTGSVEHLALTDAEVTAALLQSAGDEHAPGHDPARRIVQRDAFKLLWERTAADIGTNLNAGEEIANAARAIFGDDAVRRDAYFPERPFIDFPVLQRDGSVESARSLSEVLHHLPEAAFDFVFIQPNLAADAQKWLEDNRAQILRQLPAEE